MEFLTWLEESAVGVWISEDIWAYPIVLSCHAVGMAIVVGMVTVINLRVLGFAKRIPIDSFKSLYTLTFIGFALNFISGCLLFTNDATRFFLSNMFRAKIILIIVGMISVWLLLKEVRKNPDGTTTARAIAAVSLLCWFGAIATGRLIAYF